jgi:transcriptional regulator with XRE-family HTH domain
MVTNDGMIELGRQVELHRKKAGILQADLAEKLGVTQPMISRIERGEIRLNGELIITLAKLFGISTDELLGVKTKATSEATISRRWVKRMSRVDELGKRDQDALARIIDAFLERTTKKVAS